jgi:nucleotide-binding universal stress UspA family protein
VTYGIPADYSDVDFEAGAHQRLERALGEATGPHTVVPVERVVAEGHPAHVLITAAEGADLLAVGSQGHGGFAGVLLGSTSHYCAQHAPCPVVIVPHQRETD